MAFVIGRYEKSINRFVTLKLLDGRDFVDNEDEARNIHKMYLDMGALYQVDSLGQASRLVAGSIDPSLMPEKTNLLNQPETIEECLAI